MGHPHSEREKQGIAKRGRKAFVAIQGPVRTNVSAEAKQGVSQSIILDGRRQSAQRRNGWGGADEGGNCMSDCGDVM